jgi:uncharacterized protein (TIGR03437 family)
LKCQPGELATETNRLTALLQILFGKSPATLPYFGLAPNFVGLYQFNVTVPVARAGFSVRNTGVGQLLIG